MTNTIDLEQLAETANNEPSIDASKKEEDRRQNIFKEAQMLYKLSFQAAMQNLKVKEEDVLQAGRQLFEQGFFEKEFDLPFGGKIKLRTKKVIDELDYYKFLEEAIAKNYTMDEFQFLSSVRNLASVLVQYKDVDLSNKSFDEKFNFLLQMSTPLVSNLINIIQPFWSLVMLSMHKDFVGFLIKKTHQ